MTHITITDVKLPLIGWPDIAVVTIMWPVLGRPNITQTSKIEVPRDLMQKLVEFGAALANVEVGK